MTDLEISKALALAIGWKPEQLCERPLTGSLIARSKVAYFAAVFDYRDWNVIGLIAKRHDCFPMRIPATSGWTASTLCGGVFCADTPQLAIALAVIEASK